MRFIYQAKRKLATGHVLDDTYEILIAGEVIDPSYDSDRTQNESLDNTIEVEFFGIVDYWDVVTDKIADGQDAENFLEFIASTAAGETFSFDPTGEELGVDDDPRSVLMVSDKLRRSRPSPLYFQYSLRMREI